MAFLLPIHPSTVSWIFFLPLSLIEDLEKNRVRDLGGIGLRSRFSVHILYIWGFQESLRWKEKRLDRFFSGFCVSCESCYLAAFSRLWLVPCVILLKKHLLFVLLRIFFFFCGVKGAGKRSKGEILRALWWGTAGARGSRLLPHLTAPLRWLRAQVVCLYCVNFRFFRWIRGLDT